MNLKQFTTLFFAFVLTVCSLNLAISQINFIDEDFNGSLPDTWQVITDLGNNTASSDWVWTNSGAAGGFAAAPLASTTANNGWVLFDSDLNCSSDVGQESWLISPAMNTSGEPIIWLNFETLYYKFNDKVFIRIGTDLSDRAAWESIDLYPNRVNEAVNGNSTPNPDLISINISELAANQSTVYVAFQFISTSNEVQAGTLFGCGYSWQIDDVIVTNEDPRPAIDLALELDSLAVPPNAMTPISQIEPIGFAADISNNGSEEQSNFDLQVRVTDNGSGNEVFSSEVATTDVSLGVGDTLNTLLFPESFEAPAQTSLYTAQYVLQPDGTDANPDNNTRDYLFEITDSTFSKDLVPNLEIAPNADNNYIYGNIFHVVNGTDQFARTISFGVANAEELADRSVTAYLLEWEGDTDGQLDVDSDEYEVVAFNVYTFTGTESPDALITFPISFFLEPIPLKDDTYYVLALQYLADDDQDFFILGSDERDYFTTLLITDNAGAPRYGSCLQIGEGNISDVENNLSMSIVGFGFEVVPTIRMSVGENPLAVSTTQVQLPENALSVFPNPAQKTTGIQLDLEERSEKVNILIYNSLGQLVFNQKHSNLQRENINLDLNGWENGTYQIFISTDLGVSNETLIIQN